MSFCGHQHLAQRVKAIHEIGEEGVGSALREAPIDVDGLLQRGQRLLVPAEVGEHGTGVTQAHREIAEECVELALREAPSDVDGLL